MSAVGRSRSTRTPLVSLGPPLRHPFVLLMTSRTRMQCGDELFIGSAPMLAGGQRWITAHSPVRDHKKNALIRKLAEESCSLAGGR